MKKNDYMKPAVRVTKLMHKQCLLGASPAKVSTVSSNLGDDALIYGQGSGTNNTARGRQFDSWDEEE